MMMRCGGIFSQGRCAVRAGRRGGAFTLLEILIVLLIMGIVASFGIQAISAFESSNRAERAAREGLAAFRYARHLAMTTGKSAKVSFDTVNSAFSVYWMSNGSSWDATPVNQPLGGGTYTVHLKTDAGVFGTGISLNPAGTTAFTYNVLGSCDNATTVTFTYGTKSKTLVVPKAGDPQLN